MLGNERVRGPRALRIVGGVFLILGLIGLLAAGVLALIEIRGPRTAKADGIIVGFNYGPLVRFSTQTGGSAQFGSSVRSSSWTMGDHVAVAYAPDDPGNAAIDGFAGRWFLPGLFGILGGVFFMVGCGLSLGGRLFLGRTAFQRS